MLIRGSYFQIPENLVNPGDSFWILFFTVCSFKTARNTLKMFGAPRFRPPHRLRQIIKLILRQNAISFRLYGRYEVEVDNVV